MVQDVKKGFSKDIYLFYFKAYKLLLFLHGLAAQRVLVLEEGTLIVLEQIQKYHTVASKIFSFRLKLLQYSKKIDG